MTVIITVDQLLLNVLFLLQNLTLATVTRCHLFRLAGCMVKRVVEDASKNWRDHVYLLQLNSAFCCFACCVYVIVNSHDHSGLLFRVNT